MLRDLMSSPANKTRVLILDDEPGIRQLIRMAAEGQGCEVRDFADLAGAAAALDTFSPDLIFLDLALRNDDAVEAFRVLADRRYAGAIQLISGSDESVLDGVKAVGERYGLSLLPPLRKPFRLRQIRKALEDHLSGGWMPALASVSAPAPAVAEFGVEEALARGWLELWYQPKLDLESERVVGAEGLIRARHPQVGVVSPAAFLETAGDEALARLTEFVIVTAMADWRTFAAAGWPLQLCVNAPSSALLNVPVVDLVRRHRPDSPQWPGLVLELTEDQPIESLLHAQEVVAQLRIQKVELALDDFGTGYSSLARLRALPFHSLKIDRSFVTGCGIDPAQKELCRSIIGIARQCGCVVVAEGIETPADLAALRELGCEFGQGYLFARPMPKNELIAYLASR